MKLASTALMMTALWLGACSPWTVQYEPQGRPEAPATVRKATRFVPEESGLLAKAGGRALGALQIEGANIVADRPEDLHQHARGEAARHGATHYVHLEATLTEEQLQRINASFGLHLKTTDLVSGWRKALYLLVVVPREGWMQLPAELRPVALEQVSERFGARTPPPAPPPAPQGEGSLRDRRAVHRRTRAPGFQAPPLPAAQGEGAGGEGSRHARPPVQTAPGGALGREARFSLASSAAAATRATSR